MRHACLSLPPISHPSLLSPHRFITYLGITSSHPVPCILFIGILPCPLPIIPIHLASPERLESIRASLLAAGHLERVVTIPPRPATPLEVLAVHTAEHVEHIKQTAGWFAAEQQSSNLVSGLAQKLGYIQRGDIYYSQQTAACALLSCGSAVEVTLRVLRGELRNAFALIRPPGHHAEANKEMGFCFYNNAAVAARTALMYGARRILVLDWDVHHGNGTEHIFEATDEVMYISLHRFGAGFYPMTGAASDTGTGPGEGYSVNIPWPETETGDIDYEVAFERLVMPIAEAYDADLVIVSAGFDAAVGDPIGGMCVTPACYAYMTERLCTLAGGKVVMLLEGGYNLNSIAASATACMGTLLSGDLDQERRSSDGVGVAGTVRKCKDTTAPLLDRQARRFARYWDVLDE